MSPPGPRWALRGRANFRSQAAAPVDPKRALAEWIALADAIVERGGRIACLVPPDDTALTGLPYAAECGQIVEQKFLLPNMISPHRQGERVLWREVAVALGLEPVDLEGIWEAQGDVATFRGRTILFWGGRTDRKGLESAMRFFPKDSIVVRLREPAFHGNMSVLPLDAVDKLVVCPEVIVEGLDTLERTFGKECMIQVSESEIRDYATNGLPVGRDLLAPHLVPARVREEFTRAGMNIVTLEMRELCEKAGGASRCLVSRASIDVEIPRTYDYRVRREELASRCR